MVNMINKSTTVLIILFFVNFIQAQKNDMYIVLLAGQSNMAGRAEYRSSDTVSYANIYSLNKDSIWVRAKNPLHWDKDAAGVGMGITFAHDLALKLGGNVKIGLVPCAAGGTSIDDWLNNIYFPYTYNVYLYNNLINRAKKATQSGKIIGLIWHQGEFDSNFDKYKTYQNKLNTFFLKIRTDLKTPTLPIVAGEVGRFLVSNKTYSQSDSINKCINNLKYSLKNYEVVSSIDLKPRNDNTHFTSESQAILGIRYAESFYKIAFLNTSP